MQVCASCGEHNSERARFCQACAAALPGSSLAAEVRKTVTVVFADLAGSTALGETLDPEALREILNRYFAEMRVALERHGGVVEKYIGDAVMAVFGLPQVHEDDAMRAVRAAREMQRRLAALNDDLEREYGVRLTNRTGVHTGEVVAGDPAMGQRLVTGDAVNVAARLEQAAPPGEVLLGDPTYRLVRAGVRTEPVEPLALKGKSRPVTAHRLLEVADSAPSGRRSDTPLVGRTEELAAIETELRMAAEESRGRLVTVLGAAGVGKSRLVEEALTRARGHATVIRGRCLSYGEGITFWPLAGAVRDAAGILDQDDPLVAVGRLASLLEGHPDADRVAERIAAAAGFSATPFDVGETFWATAQLFEHLARNRALVVEFDDIHWAEPAFLDLIEQVVTDVRGPVLVLCPARHELIETRPGWGSPAGRGTTIELSPLDASQAGLMVDNLLGATAVPDEVRERITSAAEGNPLFVEQILAMFVDEGFLRQEGERWMAVSDLTSVPVPPTISALLSARLDSLRPDERSVAERAAVVGHEFYRGAVEELSPDALRPQVGPSLRTLQEKTLIGPGGEGLGGEPALRFAHALVRDAAYDGVLKRTRVDLHERFAAWLERAAGTRLLEFEEIVAYHLEQAHRYLAELGPLDERGRELGTRAAERLAASGRRALGRGDTAAAANLLGRAAALLGKDDPQRWAVLPDLGAALRESGELERAEAVLGEARSRAERSGDLRLEWRTIVEQVEVSMKRGSAGFVEEATRQSERLIPLLEGAGDELGLAKVWRMRSWTFISTSAAQFDASTERALYHARRAGDRREVIELLAGLAITAFAGPTPAPEAIERCRVLWGEVRGNHRAEGFVAICLAGLLALVGKFDEARRTLGAAADAWRRGGSSFYTVEGDGTEALLELLAGRTEAARASLTLGLEQRRALGVPPTLLAALQAHQALDEGRTTEAFDVLREAAGIVGGMSLDEALFRVAQARELAATGRRDEATVALDEATHRVAETDFVVDGGMVWAFAADGYLEAGQSDRARAANRRAVELFEAKEAPGAVRWARTRPAASLPED